MFNKIMKLLITGGAGYIGSHTALKLIEAGHNVVVVDNFYSGHRWAVPGGAELIEGDVGDCELIGNVFQAHQFDGVLHFAAHIEVGESVSNPLKYYRNNVASALNLIEAVRQAGVAKFIFSSTAAVYGESENPAPISESAPLQPMNPYGASKFMTERILTDVAAASQNALKAVILRYFNAAGARPDLKLGQATPRATHLIKVACEVAVGVRDKIEIFGTDYPTHDGTCLRDYVHVEDLAQAHVDALGYLDQGGKTDVFNVGYGKASSVLDVIESVQRAAQKKLHVEKGPRRPGDASSLAADNTKIRRALGWTPKFDNLDLICKTAYEWERELAKRVR